MTFFALKLPVVNSTNSKFSNFLIVLFVLILVFRFNLMQERKDYSDNHQNCEKHYTILDGFKHIELFVHQVFHNVFLSYIRSHKSEEFGIACIVYIAPIGIGAVNVLRQSFALLQKIFVLFAFLLSAQSFFVQIIFQTINIKLSFYFSVCAHFLPPLD